MVTKAIKAENERRKITGGTLLREPSFDAFSRMLTKAVPDDKMHGRPRKVTRAIAAIS